MTPDYTDAYFRLVEAFEKYAQPWMREDGQGGFAGTLARMAEALNAATPPGEAVSGDTHEERAHMQTIDERDHAYEIIDDILDLVLGSDRPEWSSAYDFTDAVHDVAEHVEALTKQAAQVGVNLATCDWPAKPFSVKDEPGEHDPCYLVMPDGSMVAFNHHAENGVDQARAQFVAIACNEALAKREAVSWPVYQDGTLVGMRWKNPAPDAAQSAPTPSVRMEVVPVTSPAVEVTELAGLLRECLPALSAWKREDERRYTDADGVFHLIVGPNHYAAMNLADRMRAALTASRKGG